MLLYMGTGFGYGYGYYSGYELLLFIVPFVAALIVQIKMKATYRKYASIENARHLTGAMAAEALLQNNNVQNVTVQVGGGRLSDHFDPRSNVISLSPEVYEGTSIAAVSIACHEAGHALQHAQGYKPIKIRNAILPVCNIGSTLSFPLIILGFIMSFESLVLIGIMLFAFIVVFQFATLPVEFNASRRAIESIEQYNLLDGQENRGAKKMLTAAALTYVAALAVSVAQLLRLIIRFTGNRR